MLPPIRILAAIALFAIVAAVFVAVPSQGPNCGMALTVGLVALGMAFQVKDALVKKTAALPNGAATTNTALIDLGHGSKGDFHAHCDVLVQAPVCTTGELADTQTLTYHLQHGDAADGSDQATVYSTLIVQTGAGGAGAAAVDKTTRLPSDVKRFIRLQCVKTGASNASTKSMTLQPVF